MTRPCSRRPVATGPPRARRAPHRASAGVGRPDPGPGRRDPRDAPLGRRDLRPRGHVRVRASATSRSRRNADRRPTRSATALGLAHGHEPRSGCDRPARERLLGIPAVATADVSRRPAGHPPRRRQRAPARSWSGRPAIDRFVVDDSGPLFAELGADLAAGDRRRCRSSPTTAARRPALGIRSILDPVDLDAATPARLAHARPDRQQRGRARRSTSPTRTASRSAPAEGLGRRSSGSTARASGRRP